MSCLLDLFETYLVPNKLLEIADINSAFNRVHGNISVLYSVKILTLPFDEEEAVTAD